jgi:CDGSH-type Zn-finger protein
MKTTSKKKIIISKDGPYLVAGNISLNKEIIIADSNGDPFKWEKGDKYPDQEHYALCRCGKSAKKPYCSGAHAEAKFNGTETDSRKKYSDRAEWTEGPKLDLADAEELCSGAGFCHRKGGTWENTEKSDDPKCKDLAIEQACNCPSGRLVAHEKNGQAIEPEFEPSISATRHKKLNTDGPLWIKGGIEIESADGKKYEVRKRVTLCRCGKSKNKPFCDGTHITDRG